MGCGPGRIAIPLYELGKKVVAVDLTREALIHLGRFCDIPLIRASALNLPVRDGVADLVVSTGVVHHTPDPRQGIAENCRIVKPGGRLYLRLFNGDPDTAAFLHSDGVNRTLLLKAANFMFSD